MRKKRIRMEIPGEQTKIPARVRKKRKSIAIINPVLPSVRRKKRTAARETIPANPTTSSVLSITGPHDLQEWFSSNEKILISKTGLKDKKDYRQHTLPVNLQIKYHVRPFFVGDVCNKKEATDNGIKDTSGEMSSGHGIVAHDREDPDDKVFMLFEDLNNVEYTNVYFLGHIEYIYNQLQRVVRYETSGLCIQVADSRFAEVVDNPTIQFKL